MRVLGNAYVLGIRLTYAVKSGRIRWSTHDHDWRCKRFFGTRRMQRPKAPACTYTFLFTANRAMHGTCSESGARLQAAAHASALNRSPRWRRAARGRQIYKQAHCVGSTQRSLDGVGCAPSNMQGGGAAGPAAAALEPDRGYVAAPWEGSVEAGFCSLPRWLLRHGASHRSPAVVK